MTKPKKETNRFDIKDEAKVIKALKDILSEEEHPLSEERTLKIKGLSITDPSNVIGIEPLSEEAKRCISRFLPEDYEQNKELPTLSYNAEKGKEIKCKYTTEYFNTILVILEATGEGSFELKINTDYPATLLNKHFKIILAPRIDEDD